MNLNIRFDKRLTVFDLRPGVVTVYSFNAAKRLYRVAPLLAQSTTLGNSISSFGLSMHLQILSSISEIQASDWDTLFAGDYPFCRHAFLQALELGNSVGKGTGWLPQHLVLWDGDTVVAAAPAYLKQHSYGEYLFDRVFAEAYQRHGLRYYPKLLFAVPFTPAQGPRLGIAKGVDPLTVLPLLQQALLGGADAQLHQTTAVATAPADTASTQQLCALSHWQCLYAGETEQALFRADGWLERFDVQFEWQNQYAPPRESLAAATEPPSQKFENFEQFLATLTARKRKQIRKERALVEQQGLQLRTLCGSALDADFWQQFYQFYVATYLKRSGHQGYLTLQTFLLWGRTMASQIVVFSAWHQEEMVAASLCFRSEDKLYGRYWGCSEAYAMLHFECCYYSGIDYCIAQGLTAFDAGAQGEHKLQRGFVPVIRSGFYRFLPPTSDANVAPAALDPTSVAHAELVNSMHSAIANYCREEQSMVLNYQQQARSALPFAKLNQTDS